ncbi:uncharacterized protein LOC128184951 isoform X2 [Crassostrea angulata]|uniref:uncharacterized protein LOC128184951 isoform X2 n=1 Tax=Magallana angulata TaxID=2784310 RepID=UPI0022B0FCE9|nr:uncharacterized protein LOC128184951 isoform X2 [Crassostrea angulata]
MDDDLKNFVGSHEERLLQAALSSSRLRTDLINIVIKSCNVLKPVLFTHADVVLELMNQCDKEFDKDQEGSELTALNISFEKVFSMDILKMLSASGVGDVDDEVKPAVLAIMNYLHNIEYHQNAIYSVKRKGGDTASVTAVMAHHLFSQLIPGNKYCINNRSRNLPNVCPCQQPNCGKEIKAGCTALGSGETWHGYVDILINDTIAVSVMKDSEGTSDDENPGPSAQKKLRRRSSCVKRLLLPNPQTTHVPKTNVVAFYAYMSQDFPNPGASHTLVFDTVVTNVGNGYHGTTGIFLAPETGVYVFSWSMRLFNGEYHRAELVHNYQVMGVAYLYAPTGDHTVSETIVIQVNQGDDVYLRTQVGDNNGDIESGSGGRSIFSGWKLN